MARQIRWDNINVPNSAGAFRAFDSGADRINQAIEGLQGMAAQQENRYQTEQQEIVDKNTDTLMQEMVKAKSADDLSGVDLNQFGDKVDSRLLIDAFSRENSRIQSKSDSDRDYDFQKLKHDFDVQKYNDKAKQWSEPKELYNADGTTSYVQFNQNGDSRKLDNYGRPVPKAKLSSKGAASAAKAERNMFGTQFLQTTSITDPTEYKRELARFYDDAGISYTSGDIEEQGKRFENRIGLNESDRDVLADTEANINQSRAELQSEINQGDMLFTQQNGGFPPNLLELSQGDPLPITKNGQIKDPENESWNNIGSKVTEIEPAIAVIKEELGRVPTQQEVELLVAMGADAVNGTVINSAAKVGGDTLREITRQYKDNTSSPEKVALYKDYNKRKADILKLFEEGARETTQSLTNQMRTARKNGTGSEFEALTYGMTDEEKKKFHESIMGLGTSLKKIGGGYSKPAIIPSAGGSRVIVGPKTGNLGVASYNDQ